VGAANRAAVASDEAVRALRLHIRRDLHL
jgi:hypothetical protein